MGKERLLELLKEAEARTKAKESIYHFISYVSKSGLLTVKYEPARHHQVIIDYLHSMVFRDENKACFSLPPGAAKSTYISVIFPCFLMAMNPELNILCISASATLSEDFARKRRSLMRSKYWKNVAGCALLPDAQSLGAMTTARGGTIYSSGQGASIQGLRADWIIMDDLVSGFEQASSIQQLDKMWSWLLSEARSRLKPNGRELIVATRWSAIDPIGRVLELTEKGFENWYYMRIPMVCDSEDDPIGRKIGEPLWEEWFDDKMREDAQRDPMIWTTLYQQNPLASAGEWLPQQHIHIINRKPKILKILIGVDIALTVKKKSDWTVFAVIGLDEDRNLILIDIYRKQDSVDKTARDLVVLSQQYNAHTVYIDNDNASKTYIKLVWEKSRELGIPISLLEVPMKGNDKEVRASPLRSYFLQDRIKILQANWNYDLLDELNKFPTVRHDDQVDAMAVVASQIIKQSAPHAEQKIAKQPETMIGYRNGQIILNESLDELFENDSDNRSKYAKLRL